MTCLASKEAFEYDFPNYDPLRLATAICRIQGRDLTRLHLYTGLPEAGDKRREFCVRKLQVLGTRGVVTFTRPLRYRERPVILSDGSASMGRVGTEKGIDVRLALDVVRFALDGSYDVVLPALVWAEEQL